MIRAATKAQITAKGRIQDPDVLGWFSSNWIEDCTSNIAPGYNLGFISFQRLQKILHDPLLALARKEGDGAGASKEIVDFRHQLFRKWKDAFRSTFLGWAFVDGGELKRITLTVDKRSEAVMGTVKGSFPQVLHLLYNVIPVIV